MYILSISKPSEYRFFDISEVSSYFVGKAGISCNGKTPIRLEDIVFLKEAFAERLSLNGPSCYDLYPNLCGYLKSKVKVSSNGKVGLPWGLPELETSFSGLDNGPFIRDNLTPLKLGVCVEVKESEFPDTTHKYDILKCVIFGVTTLSRVYYEPITYDCPITLRAMTAMYNFLNRCSRRFGFNITHQNIYLGGSIKTYNREICHPLNKVSVYCDTCKDDKCYYFRKIEPDKGLETNTGPESTNAEGTGAFSCSIYMNVEKRCTRFKTGVATAHYEGENIHHTYQYGTSYHSDKSYILRETIKGINPGQLTNAVFMNEYVNGGKIKIYGRFSVTIETSSKASGKSPTILSSKHNVVALMLGEGSFTHDHTTTTECDCNLCYSKVTLTSTLSTDLHGVVKTILGVVSSSDILQTIESETSSFQKVAAPSAPPEPEGFGTESKSNSYSVSIDISCIEILALYEGLTWNTTFSPV